MISSDAQVEKANPKVESLARLIRVLTIAFNLLVVLIVGFILVVTYGDKMENHIQDFFSTSSRIQPQANPDPPESGEIFWHAPELPKTGDLATLAQIEYGRELIMHTSRYLGPKGIVQASSNGMNCQNCHLEAGTKVFGNNYGSVASTYPKFRARSGSNEDIVKRVNDCFERSLNGKALDSTSREMNAIKAYITFVGSNVPKGEKANGSGLKALAYLDRAADPEKGKIVFTTKCVSCHQPDGQGQFNPDGTEYIYPPLWGKHSYNDGAGLYRVSTFAKYVKYNMPQGVTHLSPQLTDEEAWDVAAYVNSQPRPHKDVPKDWPDIAKKPADHPFGPFVDLFSEQQHKYGPYKPIISYMDSIAKSVSK